MKQTMIVITEWMHEDGLYLLEKSGLPFAYHPEALAWPRELSSRKGVKALIVRNQTSVDRALLQSLPDLLVVGRLGAGLDNIDESEAERRGIRVVYAPDQNTDATAQMALSLLLALTRGLLPLHQATANGSWPRQKGVLPEFGDLTLGLWGYGRIAQRFGTMASCLGFQVIASSPSLLSGGRKASDVIRIVSEDELLTNSHILSLHVPLNLSTKHWLNTERLQKLPRGAFVINTARGGLIDENALLAALSSDHLAGAALDVREIEPPSQPDLLATCKNVILTPHVAGLSTRSQSAIAQRIASEVLSVIRPHYR